MEDCGLAKSDQRRTPDGANVVQFDAHLLPGRMKFTGDGAKPKLQCQSQLRNAMASQRNRLLRVGLPG